MEHSIVGFEFAGDALLDGSLIKLHDGLTVLYGLNGAGKSRALVGVQNAISGISSSIDVTLVVSLARNASDEANTDFTARTNRTSGTELLLAIARELAGPSDFDATEDPQGVVRTTLTHNKANELVDGLIGSESYSALAHADQFTAEILHDRLFLLKPTGTASSPSWEAWPVADPAGRYVNFEIDRLAAAERVYNESPDDDQDAFDTFHDMRIGSPILVDDDNLTTRAGQRIVTRYEPYSTSTNIPSTLPGLVLRGPLDLGIDLLQVPTDSNAATMAHLAEITAIAVAKSIHEPEADTGWRHDYGRLQTSDPARDLSTIEGYSRRWRSSTDEESQAEQERVSLAFENTAQLLAFELAELANESIGKLLFDPPRASIEITSPLLRFARPAAQWVFQRQNGNPGIYLEQLSRAEQIWVRYAIASAVYWHRRSIFPPPSQPFRSLLAIIDEPETALHRAAEGQVARELARQARDPRTNVIVATHSPELLDTPGSYLLEVKRDAGLRGRSLISELDLSDREALARLGLNPSDLLQWPRVFLLVEGLHDEVVMNAFFADRLRASRVQILPLRGATKLPNTIDSRVLFDFTAAHMVALVDNQNAELLTTVWAEAQSARDATTVDDANRIIVSGISGGSEEARFMREWLTAAMTKGLESRVTPYGVVERDVIEYVSVEALVPGAQSWGELREQHAQDRARDKSVSKDFKAWLLLTRGVEITQESLENAVSVAPMPPLELERLMKALEAISEEDRRAHK